MTIRDIREALACESVHEGEAETEISGVYTSDLLSDVMAHAPTDSVLITIQAHRNTIAVATVADVRTVLVCNSRPVPEDMIDAASEEHISILRTQLSQFESSGRLYCMLHGITPPS